MRAGWQRFRGPNRPLRPGFGGCRRISSCWKLRWRLGEFRQPEPGLRCQRSGGYPEPAAGSLALVGAKPPKDAFLIQRLRQAGALILGKTNPSEWANMRSSHSTSGWSGRGGLTRNPYALDRNPCGSSSGSGAAVSANLCLGAVGTETDGSIVCPSSANGVVGIKPTVGLVSRSGVIPISHTQDTAGPMCRTVRDAAILLGAMAGVDPEDGATSASN